MSDTMSDNPTLWCRQTTTREDGVVVDSSWQARREDILAALPDKEWFCVVAVVWDELPCAPDEPHKRYDDEGNEYEVCHWAVKP